MAFEFLNTFLNSWRDQSRFEETIKRILPPAIQVWGKKEAVWLDTGDAWRLYIEIPELRSVINKRATMMSSNIPKLYDKSGKIVEKHWLLDLINHPNAIQSWSDVIYSIAVQDALYSNVIVYSPIRSFQIRNLFVPLPANKIEINLSGKKLKQMDKENLIDNFKFTYDDKSVETIEWQDAIYLTTADGMNIVKPISRIDTLKYPLSNIQAGYKKRNVLLENIGAIGILSAQQTDMGGAIPMTPEEREQIRKDWYRRSKDELIITEANVNWQPMSYPTKDLMLFEELTADKIALIDAFGLSINLFSSEKGSTFTNVRDSIRMVFTDTIIPETQQIYNSLISQFGLEKEGYYLEASFDHLPILQNDQKESAEVRKINSETMKILSEIGVILNEEQQSQLLNLND
jgi:HK97 family phage portal protein